MTHPRFLYHNTQSSNRDSIRENGLLLIHSETAEEALAAGDSVEQAAMAGGVFFSSKILPERDGFDTWVLDTDGLTLEPDETTDCPDPEDSWWVIWDDVPASRLVLLEAAPAPCP